MTNFLNVLEEKQGATTAEGVLVSVDEDGVSHGPPSLLSLPEFQNTGFSPDIPYSLTLEEFEALPVAEQCLRARALIRELESWMACQDGSFGDGALVPVHRFTRGGMYCRELTMPAGLLIVGKRHAKEHLVVMTKGACTLFTERGKEELSGATTFVSPAGEKRVLLTHEETTWLTIHSTPHTDLDLVEQDLIISESKFIGRRANLEIS